jgi:hypothetical protein
MHFSSATIATCSSATATNTCLFLITAVFATSGLVLETFFFVEFLFTNGESEI